MTILTYYYKDTWPRKSHVLAPLKEVASGPKGRAIICNNVLDVAFHELKNMVSAETLLNYPECTIPFTVHTYAYEKYFGAVFNQNDKYIVLFSIKLSKTQSDYTTREK